MKKNSLGTGMGVVFVLGVLSAMQAKADVMIEFREISPNPIMVRQNLPNETFMFAVVNPNNFQIVLTELTILDPVGDPNTDLMDVMTKPRFLNFARSCKVGTVLAANRGSCPLEDIFNTQDSRDPDPDVQPGVWKEGNVVKANQVGNVNNTGMKEFDETVDVTDERVGSVPEPSSLLPSATLVALTCGMLCKRRKAGFPVW